MNALKGLICLEEVRLAVLAGITAGQPLELLN